jgi:protein-S-isoprenylcysteine O-methyltransferase Ste14
MGDRASCPIAPDPENPVNPKPPLFRRALFFAYGVASYAVFLATFLYAIGFLGNFAVPRTIDGAPELPLLPALGVNLALLSAFALQHSIMARPAFKRRWTKLVPPELERSTYVLFSSLALIALFRFWQPLGGVVWSVRSPLGEALIHGLYAFGWGLVLLATFLINHFDLFGLRQAWLALRGREYTPLPFRVTTLYRFVRHPLYVGWITLFWASPTMTATRLLFAVVTTAYILVAIRFEEHDLVAEHGRRYAEYRRRVPMLVPSLRPAERVEAKTTITATTEVRVPAR